MVMLSFLQWKAESRWWFSCSVVSDFAAPWTTALQASLSFTISWSLLKLMSIESMMPSNHLICRPLLLPTSIFPSNGVFSSESVLQIMWPKYGSFSISISPSSEYSGMISSSVKGITVIVTRENTCNVHRTWHIIKL